MKTIVVIPTYDEKDNVVPMAEAVLADEELAPTRPSPSASTAPGLEKSGLALSRPSPSAPTAQGLGSSLTAQGHDSSPTDQGLDSRENFRSTGERDEPQAKDASHVELLFVDDNSPDGTGAVLDELAAKEPRIHVLHREKKEGLGRAYVAGFSKALELGAELVVQMDCDFSHDPKDVARLVEAIETPIPSKKSDNPDNEIKFPDLVIGSRYVPGGSTPGWPFKRRLISRAGGIFIRTVTGMPVRDPTGGFKCWRKTTLEKIDFTTVASAGYSFQLEMNHRTWKAGLFIKEIPIAFTDRVAGYSKITAGIAKESLKIAWRLHR